MRGAHFTGAGHVDGSLWPALSSDNAIAHEALTDVAKFLGFRDDRGEDPDLMAHDKYQLAQKNDPEGLRRRAVARAAGQTKDLPAVRWRPSLLEGG